MKKALAFLLLCVASFCALAQVPYIAESQLEPHAGFFRKSPCAAGNGDLCGSNPPTWHALPAACGHVFSTSAFRNADSSVSTRGARITLPTVAEFTAAGYTSGGATGAGGYANRQGYCEISFVMGLPLPENYLRIGIEGVQGTDKVTFNESGGFRDMFNGDAVFQGSTGVVTAGWNGTSWLIKSGSPNLLERMHMGQQQSQGGGRLFLVTADPSWWTVGTAVGKLAWCPFNGRAVSTDDNGFTNLHIYSLNCVFRAATAGIATEWITLRYIGNSSTTAIAAGAAYGAGTAPNGVAYAAGNYAVLSTTASTGFITDGMTVQVDDLPTTLGGNYLHGKWIAKVLTGPVTGCPSGTCLELHEKVDDAISTAVSSVGPPSAFIAGDTILAGVTNPLSLSYYTLQTASIATAPVTNPNNGLEIEGSNRIYSVVGMAKRSGGVYLDSATSRTVSSRFNPMEKECRSVTAADRTTASTSFVLLNADAACTFTALNHSSAIGKGYGDTGRGVRWSLTITMSNGTASDGCEAGVGFDGSTTAEPTIGRIMNGANVEGAKSITITGIKTGLSETVTHTVTPLIRAVTGGTCTVTAATTSMSAFVWQ